MKKIYIELQNFCLHKRCNTKCKAQKVSIADRYIMSSAEVTEIFSTIPTVIKETYCTALYGCGDSSDYKYTDLDNEMSKALITYAVINRNYSKVSLNPDIKYVARFFNVEDLLEVVDVGIYDKAIAVLNIDTPLYNTKLLKDLSKKIWIEFYPNVEQFDSVLDMISIQYRDYTPTGLIKENFEKDIKCSVCPCHPKPKECLLAHEIFISRASPCLGRHEFMGVNKQFSNVTLALKKLLNIKRL